MRGSHADAVISESHLAGHRCKLSGLQAVVSGERNPAISGGVFRGTRAAAAAAALAKEPLAPGASANKSVRT